LDAGVGRDTMAGGTGDDTYVVENSGDKAIENANEGIDIVKSSVSYTLGSNVENLVLMDGANINGTGNDEDNIISGNAGNNILAGLGGADILYGGSGNDTATFAASPAGVNVSLTTHSSSGGDAEGDALYVENLTGSAFNDLLEGDGGNNVLVGGAGSDTVSYEHASSGVTVSLAITAAQVTGAGVDMLSGFENLTGSNFDDVLTGSSAANVITGLDGNDTLTGLAGTDTLIGGTGSDHFVFAAAPDSRPNAPDVIVDFEHGDSIDLTAIDANTSHNAKGDQAFGFGGQNSSVVANTVTWFEQGGNTFVQADVNGDAKADFTVELLGINHNLTASDFLL
jgi:Ca2+-binding RTX toxin-like protein